MAPALEATLFVLLVATLCGVSALAGALWWRSRSMPLLDVARLAGELAERQKALEILLLKVETTKGRRLLRASPGLRRDRAESVADQTGPTLISVPDLAAPPGNAERVSADMARRFGPIWALSDQGASPMAISQATGQPVGQIELILGLRHLRGA